MKINQTLKKALKKIMEEMKENSPNLNIFQKQQTVYQKIWPSENFASIQFKFPSIQGQFEKIKRVLYDSHYFLRGVAIQYLEYLIKYSQEKISKLFIEIKQNSQKFNQFIQGSQFQQHLNYFFLPQQKEQSAIMLKYYIANLIVNIYGEQPKNEEEFHQVVEKNIFNWFNAFEFFDILMIEYMRIKITVQQQKEDQSIFDLSQLIDESKMEILAQALVYAPQNVIQFNTKYTQEQKQLMNFLLIENNFFIAQKKIEEISVIQNSPQQQSFYTNNNSFDLLNQIEQIGDSGCLRCNKELYHSSYIECGHKICEECLLDLMSYSIMDSIKIEQEIKCLKCRKAIQDADVLKFLPHLKN